MIAMSGTFSDWIIEGKKRGLEEAVRAFHSDKLEDYKRLKASGLPIFDDLIVPYLQFGRENNELMEFLAKYPGFVVRAIPKTKELPRRYRIGVHSFEECKAFLEENVRKGMESVYSVLLTEHEPTDRSGIIISNHERTLVEVAEAQLDELSSGKVIPSTGEFFKQAVFKRMHYRNANAAQRELIWKALQYLRIDLPSDSAFPDIDFMVGYFEFVVTKKTDRIKFLDYKLNEMYTK
jgi:hypothetical protein